MLHLLWIDDEPYYMEAHRIALQEAGYDVEIIQNEDKALSRLSTFPLPDLIILDIILPKSLNDPGPDNGMSTGIHLLKHMSNDVKRKVPVIVLTIIANQIAHDRLIEISEQFKSLVVRVKPFLPSELLDEVNTLINQQKVDGGNHEI